jgi:hypothetical protein
MDNSMINKVAESGIITLDLEDHYPKTGIMLFDLKEFLFMGLILKEKDYREALKNYDFTVFQNQYVGITCSADAIIPMWAFMLATSYIQPFANAVFFGDEATVKEKVFLQNIATLKPADFTDQRVVIKGCGELPISEGAYIAVTEILRPVAKSIMYGEPCSTVPIYKKPREI